MDSSDGEFDVGRAASQHNIASKKTPWLADLKQQILQDEAAQLEPIKLGLHQHRQQQADFSSTISKLAAKPPSKQVARADAVLASCDKLLDLWDRIGQRTYPVSDSQVNPFSETHDEAARAETIRLLELGKKIAKGELEKIDEYQKLAQARSLPVWESAGGEVQSVGSVASVERMVKYYEKGVRNMCKGLSDE